MFFKIVLEAFRIDKMKSYKAVRLWFLIIFLLRAGTTLLPFGDRNFNFLNSWLDPDAVLHGKLQFPTAGNWVVIGVYLLVFIISLFFSFLYSQLLLFERHRHSPVELKMDDSQLFIFPMQQPRPLESFDDFRKRVQRELKPVTVDGYPELEEGKIKNFGLYTLKTCVNALPRVILFGLISIPVLLISVPLFMIPALVFFTMFFFVPLNISYGKHSLGRSMELSNQQTKNSKILILIMLLFSRTLINLALNLVGLIFAKHFYSYGLFEAFFYALRTMVVGRLAGMLFLNLGLHRPFEKDFAVTK